jgi:hypothetical protein
MRHYGQTGNIEFAALKSGMTRKTASKYIRIGTLPSEIDQVRDWRTREDPLEKIWIEAEAFLLDSPGLESKALLEHLIEKYPDQINQSHLRTFQRRVKSWRLQSGSKQEVFFDQNRKPGECMELDWTDMNALEIIVAGEHYLHKLIHLVLPYSNYEGAVRCRSESILAIKKILKHFLYSLNATPLVLQVDNSSAATHQIKKTAEKRGFNEDLVKIADYYGFSLRATNVDSPNENGDVESLNGHLKRRINQALLLRGSRSFNTLEDYDLFLQKVFEKANKTRIAKLNDELKVMKSIPENPLPEYQEIYVTVRSGSTANIKKVTYSVPSRLIGSKLKAKIYENIVELYDGANLVHKMPRVLGDRGQVIDYRHIIHSLIRKPAAFQNYRYREEMYPTNVFRIAFDKLISVHGERNGLLDYLRILKLAAETMESEVEAALSLVLESVDFKVCYEEVEALVNAEKKSLTDIIVGELVPDLTSYDDLIKGDNADDICTNQSTIAEGPQPLSNEHVLSGSDDKIPESQLVLGENITKSIGDRNRLSQGEKDRELTQTSGNTASIYSGDIGPKTIDTETSKIITNIIGRKFCEQSGKLTGIWITR